MNKSKILGLLKTNLEQIQQGNNYALIDLEMLNEKYANSSDEEIVLSLQLNNSISFYSYYSQYDKAIENSLKALHQFSECNQNHTLAFHCWVVGHCYAHTGNFNSASEYLNRALAIISDNNLPYYSLKCDCLHSLAMVNHFSNGKPEKTLEYLQLAMDSLIGSPDFIPDKVRRASYLSGIGNVYINAKRINEALENYTEALAIYEQVLDLQNMANAYSNIATCYIESGEYNIAEEYLHKSLELRHKAGSPYALSISYHNLGLVYQAKNEWDLAEEYLLKGKEILLETNSKIDIEDINEILAEIAVAKNKALQII